MRSVLLAVVCAAALLLGGCAEDPTTPAAHSAPAHRAKKGVHTRTVHQRQPIPFPVQNRKTSALRQGDHRVLRPGRPGVRVVTWRVTTKDGVTTARKRVGARVVRKPVPRVVLVGTLRTYTPRCDSNYTGACVPVASDVDCRGGSGDGPKYVAGPVRVVGYDRYGLDADGDGWGCD